MSEDSKEMIDSWYKQDSLKKALDYFLLLLLFLDCAKWDYIGLTHL